MARQRTFSAALRKLGSGLLAVACVTSAAVTMGTGASAAQHSRATFEFELHDGLLTLRAEGAPLVDVIRAIGEQAGFETLVYGDLDDELTRTLSGVALETALRQLLSDVSNVIRFERVPTRRPTEVSLYADEERARRGAAAERSRLPITSRTLDQERAAGIAETRVRAGAGDAQATAELGQLLSDDADPAIRGEAATALGEIGDDTAVDALQVGAQDEEQQVRIRSIRALAGIVNDPSTQVLADVLLNHPDTRTRLLAVWALDQHGTPLARSYLEAAQADADDQVREAALRTRGDAAAALETQGETAGVEAQGEETQVEQAPADEGQAEQGQAEEGQGEAVGADDGGEALPR